MPLTSKTRRNCRFEKLAVEASDSSSVQLRSAAVTARISVLAEDLFRLRITRGRTFSSLPSWAVTKGEWPPVDVQIANDPARTTVRTDRGELGIDLENGAWELRDLSGLVLFSAEPGMTAFTQAQAEVTLSLAEEEAIFGMGESTGTFNKRGLVRKFWNVDVGSHARTVNAGVHNMYVSIPFGISLRHGRAAGLFWDDPGLQTWDLGQTDFGRWKMTAAAGEVDLYLFLGPSCVEIVGRLTELTGRTPLPPQWALGYQQCRYSYETRERVEEVARTFRKKRIPCDVVYLDIHHMDGYRVFTFGKDFPNPAGMIARLAAQGFKTVTIVDPGVKDDPRFPVLRRGIARNAFVKAADGRGDYLGKVWPGRVRFPDFLNPATRAWWGEEQARFQRLGIAGFWNDMNEPADFSGPNKDFPGDCLHQGESGRLRHAGVHNVYGSEMARASYEGGLAVEPDKRPFVITRAGYAGLQRYASVWTGDNESSWEQMADSIPMLLNLGVSGVAFCGADAGGFHQNATGELLARWMQLAAFTPLFRNHSNLGTIDQEPWAFGPRIEAICRRYIELRYQLLPYFYSLFAEAHRGGAPIMRPLFWHDQNDPIAAGVSDQFLAGPDLMVAPILRQGAVARSVYLPRGEWFDFWTGQKIRGGQHVIAEASLERLPLFVRGGAILPFIPVQQHVGELDLNLVTLHIWPGTDGELDWYEDDGSTLQYRQGRFHRRPIRLSSRNRACTLTFAPREGDLSSRVKQWRIVLRSIRRPVRVSLAGRAGRVRFDATSAVCAFEVANPEGASVLRWR